MDRSNTNLVGTRNINNQEVSIRSKMLYTKNIVSNRVLCAFILSQIDTKKFALLLVLMLDEPLPHSGNNFFMSLVVQTKSIQ